MNETYITLRMPSGHIEKITRDEWEDISIALTLPSGHIERITQAEMRSLRGSANRQLPGAARVKGNCEQRCPCGALTRGNARRRGHICTVVECGAGAA